jgi:hypothetical protein
MCHKTIILPAVLFGFESWPLVLKEEYGFWLFENRVRKLFGHKGEDVTGEQRKYLMESFEVCTLIIR